MTTYTRAHTHTHTHTRTQTKLPIPLHKLSLSFLHSHSPSFLHSHSRSFPTPPISSLLAITCKFFRHTTHALHFMSRQYFHLPSQLFSKLSTPFARTNLYDAISRHPLRKIPSLTNFLLNFHEPDSFEGHFFGSPSFFFFLSFSLFLPLLAKPEKVFPCFSP